ncbi:Calcium-transporting ATPase 10, plasma membrane-type [Entophlyctis luteolus]|nr:Calcium-transporting ATPase 10, plasma membrane-type [Entophlyctis luteolus]KAJ3355205.1 Calcium-transporting ATPase 10, plasma membrane-type [Entophlyctis luteolus]
MSEEAVGINNDDIPDIDFGDEQAVDSGAQSSANCSPPQVLLPSSAGDAISNAAQSAPQYHQQFSPIQGNLPPITKGPMINRAAAAGGYSGHIAGASIVPDAAAFQDPHSDFAGGESAREYAQRHGEMDAAGAAAVGDESAQEPADAAQSWPRFSAYAAAAAASATATAIDSSTIEEIRQRRLAAIKQQQSRRFDSFGVTPSDLAAMCSFDLRTSPAQVELLNTSYGGAEGLALLLRSDIDKGLRLRMKDHTAIPITGANPNPAYRHSKTTAPALSQQQQQQPQGVQNEKWNPFKMTSNLEEKFGASNPAMVPIDSQKRIEVFGLNKIPPPRSDTILEIVWGTIVEDPILKILIVGAILVLSLGTAMCPSDGWLDGVVIVVAVVIVLSVTAGNDYSKDKKFKKLLLMQSNKKVKVIRGGKKDEVSSWDVLVGDIVEVSTGDEIPADGIYVSGNRLVIDESPLTGETIPVKKSQDAPFVFSGCQVSEGSGRILVTGVGSRSSGGQIQELLNEAQNEETVLQMKLKVVAVLIGKIGVAAGIATFLGLTLRWAIAWAQGVYIVSLSCGGITSSGIIYRLTLLAQYFVVGITVVVVAVPEGLPLAVTISLAFSMFKMIKENCFVRHLDASETMGEATCICTDKTGTLTENKMTVVKFMMTGRIYHGEGSGEADAIKFNGDLIEGRLKNLLVESICINSDCFIKMNEAGNQEIFIGSATEGALLVFAKKMGVNYEEVRRMVKKVEGGVWTFSSERKRMSTLIYPRAKAPSASTKYRLHSKGASEIILSLCTHILSSSLVVEPLTPEVVSNIQKTIKMWANEGLRTVGIAYRNTDQLITSVDAGNGISDDPEHDMVWVALMAIKDPLRKEVPGAVATCQKAGLVIRMVTGDNILTACKIARECGIMFGDGMALEGPVFRAMSTEEKMAVIPKLQVLARSSPSDKHTLVSLLKDMGEVVAVTGDGTNDAPALKEADVGFAMGISGTQIARNACDIVLLDDNFVSLVCAIKWGRNVLNSIRKFLQFQLGVNLVAIVLTFVGSVSVGDSPLNTVQLLWVNLIMDSLGALALASDDPDDDILDHPPHARTASLLSPYMQEYILTQLIYQLVCTLGLLMGIDKIYPPDSTWHDASAIQGNPSLRAKTMVFTTFIFLQVTNEIMARQLNGELNVFAKFFRNKLFLGILVSTILVQVLCINWGSAFFSTCTLTWQEWVICVALSLGNIPFTFLCRLVSKLFPHRRERHHAKKIVPESAQEIKDVQDANQSLQHIAHKTREPSQIVPKVRTTSLMKGAEASELNKSQTTVKSSGKSRWTTVQAATHLIGHMQEVTKEDFVATGPTPEFIDTWMRFRKDATYAMKNRQ